MPDFQSECRQFAPCLHIIHCALLYPGIQLDSRKPLLKPEPKLSPYTGSINIPSCIAPC